MCILCVASRWSRRIVTMLPWLIIPLIILWALSQLFPPGFRFEVTSPRLACVAVLLVSLAWYELVMPCLSTWRAKRSALLRERIRIEAQEAAKWRKEATRRCRNCLSAYRDQTPCGGRFMCTFCGHISKRPALDLPDGSLASGPLSGLQPFSGSPPGARLAGPRSTWGWGGRGWSDMGGWVIAGREWARSKGWTSGAAGWGGGGGGAGAGAGAGGGGTSWSLPNWAGKNATGSSYCGGMPRGTGGGTSSYSDGFYGADGCVAGDSQQRGLSSILLQRFSFVFCCLTSAWRRLWGIEQLGEDGGPNGSRRGGQRAGDDTGISQGRRGEKSRKKAEEKRQARLEREQLEAEERRQREEVARLVQERSRQRNEKLEAEKNSEREAAAERERELRREREAERRRLEKIKEREKDWAKDKFRETETDESKRKKEKKDVDKKPDPDKRSEKDKGSPVQNAEPFVKKIFKGSKEGHKVGVDMGHKAGDTGLKGGIAAGMKPGGTRYGASAKAGSVPTRAAVAQQNNESSFWGRGFAGGKLARGAGSTGSAPVTTGNISSESATVKHAASAHSTWNRMPWNKAWGKSTVAPLDNNLTSVPGVSSGQTETPKHVGVKSGTFGSPASGVSEHSHPKMEVERPTPERSPQRRHGSLRTSDTDRPTFSPAVDTDARHDRLHTESNVKFSHKVEELPVEAEYINFFSSSPQVSATSRPGAAFTPAEPHVNFNDISFGPGSPSLGVVGLSGSAFIPAQNLTTTAPNSSSPVVHAPIGKPVLPPVSRPMHMPAPIQAPLPLNSQKQTSLPQDQMPQSLGPWGQPSVAADSLTEGSVGEKWQMWDTPQLDKLQLASIAKPLNSWNYLGSAFGQQQPADKSRPQLESPEPVNQLPASLFSPNQAMGSVLSSGSEVGTLPACNSQSLFYDHSAYESTMRLWDDSDTRQGPPSEFLDDPDFHQHVPPEFVDCITQEVMKDPVITADGHSYERAAIERWLRTHDTSPVTGEVLPAPPGGYGSGIDKSLRPNHILRGQIIEYREKNTRGTRGSLQDSSMENSWSMGLELGDSAWPTDRLHIPGLYATPGAQSVWSYDGFSNPQNPVLPPI